MQSEFDIEKLVVVSISPGFTSSDREIFVSLMPC